MPSIVLDGVRLAYDDIGAGPPVVWVHGSWTDRHGAARFVPLLGDRYRVISYDRRGHSESERPNESTTMATHVADLAALIEALGAAPAHLVGNSSGGEVALKLAIRRPELVATVSVHEPGVEKIVGSDPAGRRMLTDVAERMDRVAAEVRAGRHEGGARMFIESLVAPGMWAQLPERVRRTCTFNAPTFLDELDDPETGMIDLDAVARIAVPVQLTDGAYGVPELRLAVERLASALPKVDRYTFPEAGHVPHLSHPEEFAAVVGGFLAAHEAGTRVSST